MAIKITESRLRQIIREEAEGLPTTRRSARTIAEGKATSMATIVADSIVDEIGMKGAAELQAAFRSGQPTAIEALEELIDDHSDGEMNASSPKVQEKVCVALEVMLGLAPAHGRKGFR
jgi:hypothetical protein